MTVTAPRLTPIGKAGIEKHSPIDEESDAVNIIGVVRGQPHGCLAQIVRPSSFSSRLQTCVI